jgi:hypothetical protein
MIFVFHSESGNENPVIIVSLVHFICHFETNFKDALLGNRREILEKITQFLAELKRQGVKLIFPMSYDNEIEDRLKKKFQYYKDGVELIDQIEKDNNLESLSKFYGMQNKEYRALYGQVLWELLLDVAAENGEFEPFCIPHHHTTVFYRKLAKDLNAFAILACDSNYIIAEGSWKYWAANDLNFVNFTVKEYDKQAVLDNLGLRFQQIPLFQAMGGVLMSAEDLEVVQGIFGFRPSYFFRNLAHYVRINFTSPPTFTDLQEIKRFVIRKCRIGQNLTVHFVGDLQKALRYITIPVILKILKIPIDISTLFLIFRNIWKIAATRSKATRNTAKDSVSIF